MIKLNNKSKIAIIAGIVLLAILSLIIYNQLKTSAPEIDAETLQIESNTSIKSSVEADKLVEEIPVVKQLPYIEDSFRIDYGLSNDENSDATALYITSDSEEAEKKALEWLRNNNVDTEKVEIIFNAE